jgi:ATP/maltotriose-dependent transcriptional regulator MalT
VGREPELEELHKKLDGDGSRRMVVLHGLGGIGKTQLSVAYAKRHKEKYSAIFWLDIRDEDSIKQSFAKVAKQILREHPSAFPLRDGEEEEEEDVDEVVNAVKNWLSEKHNTRWLLIFDNYDNPKVPGSKDTAAMNIKRFLPESYQGSILIITRSSQVRIGHSIKIRKFSNVRDSLEILSTASRREGLRDGKSAIIFITLKI